MSDCNNTLKSLRKDNLNKLISAHLNINSIRNKFELLSEQIKGNVDVLMISETKIDDSFPVGQFLIEGFCTPYRLDRNSKGGGILLYVREDIPSNLITVDISPIESFYVELNLRNNKWLINCSYNPHKCLIGNHLDAVSKTLDLHSSTYDKIILLGDFNTEIDEQHMQSFCDNYSLKSLIRQPTCYKNFGKPTCIDLILTNMPRSFHPMTLTVMRKNFKKIKPRIINYRSYKNFSNEYYRKCLFNELKRETFVNNDRGFEKFCDMSIKLLKRHALIKKEIQKRQSNALCYKRFF